MNKSIYEVIKIDFFVRILILSEIYSKYLEFIVESFPYFCLNNQFLLLESDISFYNEAFESFLILCFCLIRFKLSFNIKKKLL